MSNELTITSIYNEVATTEDELLDSISRHGAYSKAHGLRQCYDCYKFRELINATSAYGSAEKKARMEEAVKRLGPDAKMNTFKKYANVGNKIQVAIDNGEKPEIALNRTMYYYLQLDTYVSKLSEPTQLDTYVSKSKPKKPVDAKIQELQDKLDNTLEELDAYKTWKKKILSAIRQQDLEYIRQLMKE